MKIKLIFLILLLSCSSRGENHFEKIKDFYDIPSESEWILILNPTSCKTCFEGFINRLQNANIKSKLGSIIIISTSVKEFKIKHTTDNWERKK